MDKKKARIDELLNYKNRSYDIFEQKAELLLRNSTFLRDCTKLRVYFLLRRRMDQIIYEEMRKGERKVVAVAPYKVGIIARRKALSEFGLMSWPKHKWFYKKWEIRDFWMGLKENLNRCIHAGPLLCVTNPNNPFGLPLDLLVQDSRGGPVLSKSWYELKVYILVDPWTTSVEIKKLCKRLPELKKEYFGFTTESKRHFARDLCWYDLKNELKLTPTVIAKAWADKKPDELRVLAKNTKEWKAALPEDKDAILNDFIVQGLPSVVGAAIVRLQTAIQFLNR